MERFHTLKVDEVVHETSKAVLIRFEVPQFLKEAFSFTPGQYISLEKEINGEKVRRSYSICSGTDEPLQVGIKEIPKGVFSAYAKHEIRVGDPLMVSIPEGLFVYEKKETPEKISAFAAGSGITPIMSIIKSVLTAHPQNKFHLIYGNKTPEDAMFAEALKSLENEYKERFNITWVFSQANEENSLFGRVNPAIVKNYLKNEKDEVSAFYLCGPEAMINTVSETLSENGVASSSIYHELFTSAKSAEITSGEENKLTIVCDAVTHVLENKDGKTILDAALQEKIEVPYSCQGGVCSSCIARVESGTARMESNQILTDDEVEEGLILTCQAIATSPSITVNFDDV